MALVSLTNIVNGTLADATAIMNNYNAIAAQVNGNLDTTNIAANGVGNAQLAANAVTSAKILDGTIVSADLAQDRLIIPSGAVVTGGLALATGRQPNVARPTFVVLSFGLVASVSSGGVFAEARIGATAVPATAVGAVGSAVFPGPSVVLAAAFIVPAGWYYGGFQTAASGGGSVNSLTFYELAL